MIARKITYQGRLDAVSAEVVFDIARRVEITGEIKFVTPNRVELDLEGDAAIIKLVQHQVERKLLSTVEHKEVTTNPFRHYAGLDLLR